MTVVSITDEMLERQLGTVAFQELARSRAQERDLDARLFASSGADALRTSIAKACKAAGITLWSPHDLRHRWISLLHARGVPWARIAEFVGQRDLSVTANTYTHVLSDETELDYARYQRARSRTQRLVLLCTSAYGMVALGTPMGFARR